MHTDYCIASGCTIVCTVTVRNRIRGWARIYNIYQQQQQNTHTYWRPIKHLMLHYKSAFTCSGLLVLSFFSFSLSFFILLFPLFTVNVGAEWKVFFILFYFLLLFSTIHYHSASSVLHSFVYFGPNYHYANLPVLVH